MSLKFGRIDRSETTFEENIFHKNQTLTSASEGTHHYLALKDDYLSGTTDLGGGLLSVSGSHWAFVHNMFYMSGSTKISQSNPDEINKFNNYWHNFNQHNDLKPFHKNKFYDSASIFYIPQQYFGERIKPGSFILTARTGSAINTTKEIVIKDDKNGNLYGYNSHHSQSVLTSISSSDNYVGNIFYDLGVTTLTETASWSGSVNYTDIGRQGNSEEQAYKFWELKFNSTTPIFTSQYSVKINAGSFNTSVNNSSRGEKSGSDIGPMFNIKNMLTGSGWSPYFTQIHLHRKMDEEPVISAMLPRAIKMRDDIDLIITFRMDH